MRDEAIEAALKQGPPSFALVIRDAIAAYENSLARCGTCGGSGQIVGPPHTPAYDWGGFPSPVRLPCDRCNGTGQDPTVILVPATGEVERVVQVGWAPAVRHRDLAGLTYTRITDSDLPLFTHQPVEVTDAD